VEKEVEVHLDDFAIEDLIEFIESEGYTVLVGKTSTRTKEDLIEFIESEGYTVLVGKTSTRTKMNTEKLDVAIWDLYQTFMTDKGDNHDMDRALRSFFAEYYNKVSV
jgi:hypothetical protein